MINGEGPIASTFDHSLVDKMERAFLAANLKESFEKHPVSDWEHTTFGDLAVGDKYIGFPVPGDNQGHGGFRGTHNLFEKIREKGRYNTQRCLDGQKLHHNSILAIIQVR